MTAHRLTAAPETVHWGFLSAELAPVLRIASGDIVTFDTVSGSAADLPPPGLGTVRSELSAIHRAHSPAPGPHILTGPVFVEGARPGDLLKVEILEMALRDDWGFNIIQPGKGALPDDFAQRTLAHFAIDRQGGCIATPWGATLAASPFFGIIATAPRPTDGPLTSVVPGYFGGNIDNRDLTAGATLYLPVSVEGALLSVGDGHGTQGDGEVCLTAVETGLTGRLRISVIPGAASDAPRAETATHLIAMAFDEDLDVAVVAALRQAVALVVEASDLTREEAYMLISIAGDVRITQLVNVKKGVHVMIPKAAMTSASKKED
jgi:acetamidase/formamidase